MRALLRISGWIDRLSDGIGRIVYWLVLLAVLVSAGNAVSRYAFNMSSNAWLEIQWYLFSAIFLLGAGYTLRHNEHIRIDVLSSRFPRRAQAWIDVFGTLLFLLPVVLYVFWASWPMVEDSFLRHEISTDAGGLVRWPVKLLIPIGFGLLALQGVSELIKRIAFLRGLIADPFAKPERPAELEMVQPQGPVS